jgi:predicted DNA repair protein MutK
MKIINLVCLVPSMKILLVFIGIVLLASGFIPQVVNALPAFSTWGLCFAGIGFLIYGLTAKNDE